MDWRGRTSRLFCGGRRQGGGAVCRLCLSLDWRVDQAAPLRPGAVVVAHVRVAQQVFQNEPRVRRPLADAAVGDDLFVRGDVLASVEGPKLGVGLESTVLAYGLGPNDVPCAWDVTAALGALLR